MEFKVINEQLPVIAFNFDELKSNLALAVDKYSNLVVTEDNLQDCKAIQKELAGIRIKIDEYRKTKKKELSKPITDFENQCKQLIDVIEKVEKSIKEGTNIFDDKKRDEKKSTAEILIKHSINKHELNEKYAAQLTVLDKYTNLTAKEKDVADDLDTRASFLKEQQDKESEMLEIIKDTIENANKNINAKMSIADFQRLINQGVSTKEIMNEINSRADRIKQAEIEAEERRAKKVEEDAVRARLAALPHEQAIEQPALQTIQQEQPKQEDKPVKVEGNLYFVELRFTGTIDVVSKVSEFLKSNNIQYTKLKTGKIE